MLLEFAMGDAYGAGFEFSDFNKIKRHNNLTCYIEHELDPIIPGKYTDDTQMTIAICEFIISGKEWTEENFVQSFLDNFHRDPRITYSKGFLKLLQTHNKAKDFLLEIDPYSSRNGSVMRSMPVGLFSDINKVISFSEFHTPITHYSKEAIEASKAIALLTHYFYYTDKDIMETIKEVQSLTSIEWKTNKIDNVECDAVDTVNAVFTILSNNDTLYDILKESVNLGGDVDTVSALSLGIASLNNKYRKNLPEFLYNDLENDVYGRDYITDLENKLFKNFNR